MRRARLLAALAVAALSAAGAASPPAQFAAALAPRSFVFPADHGPHREFRQEWWYVTGNLDGGGGERLGFELTFFRFALEPEPPGAALAPLPPDSPWRSRQIYLAHFAITDVALARFSFAQKLSREALGLAGAVGQPLRVWIDDWSIAAAGDGDGSFKLHAAQAGYELDLTLEAQVPPVLNGAAGLSRKSDSPADASYYYSIPRLAAHGTLLRHGATLEVHGVAWLDREWGSGALPMQQAGWDWFALQLDDGSTLMFYALRDRDGRRNAHSAGTFLEAGGATRALAAGELDVEVTRHWSNPHGTRYPGAWRIRVPALALEVEVRPVLPDQELLTTPPYWEGAVDVGGTRAGRRIGGRGYVELVGYGPERPFKDPSGAAAALGR